eukprot:5394158-Heterocapsa_arctica.AAC.1
MRQEHHAILLAQTAKHAAVLQGKEDEAAHNAACARQAAALALQESEQMSAEVENNWQNSSKRWYDKQATNQNQTDWEAKKGLGAQAQVFQDLASHRESVIAGLQHEMTTRDSLNAALALSRAAEIENLLEKSRVMQKRLDVQAAAAPLRPVQ